MDCLDALSNVRPTQFILDLERLGTRLYNQSVFRASFASDSDQVKLTAILSPVANAPQTEVIKVFVRALAHVPSRYDSNLSSYKESMKRALALAGQYSTLVAAEPV